MDIYTKLLLTGLLSTLIFYGIGYNPYGALFASRFEERSIILGNLCMIFTIIMAYIKVWI